MFYHLVQNPSIVERLRKEIQPLFGSDGAFSHRDAQHADIMNGVINEALRLHPAVPTAVQRMTPPEGLQLGDTYIPGNVTVWCPQYAIGRCTSLALGVATYPD
jgi:cytochrome P450